MRDTLVTICEIKNKKVNCRLFACDSSKYLYSDYGDPLDEGLSYANCCISSDYTAEDIIKKLDLEEVKFEDIVNGKVKLTKAGEYEGKVEFHLSDVDFTYYGASHIKHYFVDGCSDKFWSYGTEDENLSRLNRIDPEKEFNIKAKFTDTNEDDRTYGVITFASLDEEAHTLIYVFKNEKDAQTFLDLYKPGEIGNYIYLSDAYNFYVHTAVDLPDYKVISFFDICENPNDYKNLVLMPQVVCLGADIYN